MNRRQLVEALATHFEGNKKQAAQALDAVLDTITHEVARGEKVAIKGFGAFEKAVRPARMVPDPSTGEVIQTSARVVLRFRPSAQLRDVISGAAQLPARTLGAAKAAGGAFMGRRSDAARSGAGSEADPEPEQPADTAKKSTTAKKATSGTTAKKTTPAKKTTSAKKTTAGTTARKATSGTTAKKSTPSKSTTAKKTTAKKSDSSS